MENQGRNLKIRQKVLDKQQKILENRNDYRKLGKILKNPI